MDCKALALQEKDYIIGLRRWFHVHPELGTEEIRTTERIAEELRAAGVEVETFPDITGCIGTLHGEKPGPTVMLRADIDALPIQEAASGKPYCSQNPGVMHACGHDCHAAMLLGAAKLLAAHKNEIAGTVKFLFQMAEEIGTESRHYVEKGCLNGVDAIYGMHVWSLLPAGTFNLEDGPRMACSDRFTIRIHGQAAHGSAPHQGHDAVVAAAGVVMALQTLVSRVNDPQNTFVLTTGIMNGGTRDNIIAAEAELIGTTRTFDKAFRKTIPELIRRTAEAAAEAYGCTADCTYFFGPAPLINDHPGLNDIARHAAESILGPDSLVPMERQMGAEDFSVYMDGTPGLYGFLGCRNEEKGITSPHHSDTFDVDEDVLPLGTAIYMQFALDFLNRK